MFRFRTIGKNQKGFTLIEIIIAIAVTSLIGVGVTAAIFNTLSVNALSSNHLTVLKQIENAAHWINRDVQMSQTVQPGGGSGFPLTLSWVEWDNTAHQVTYSLVSGELQRSHSVDGSAPTQYVVAEYISNDPAQTSCQFTGGVFTFKITASVGGFRPAIETRTAQVIPRAAS